MNNKFLPSLVTGFAAGVLLSIPGAKNLLVIFIVIPMAVYFALLLNIKLNNGIIPVKKRTALLFALLTGLWAAFFSASFETLLTFVTHSNDFIESFPEMQKLMKSYSLGPYTNEFLGLLSKMYNDIRHNGFSPLYTFMLLSGNLFMYIFFGLIGALISRIFLNKPKPQQ